MQRLGEVLEVVTGLSTRSTRSEGAANVVVKMYSLSSFVGSLLSLDRYQRFQSDGK